VKNTFVSHYSGQLSMALEAIFGGTAACVLEAIGFVGNAVFGLPPVRDWLSGCKIRLMGGRSTPGNHDLVRGIRTAHLCALDVVSREHAKAIDEIPSSEIDVDEVPFSLSVRSFIDQRLSVLTINGIDHDILTSKDIDHVLNHVAHPGDIEGYSAVAQAVRNQAIARALAEVELAAGRSAPPLFRRMFEGHIGSGWYEPFALYVTEQLKTNERFRSIFFAAELVDAKRAVAALSERADMIFNRFPNLHNFVGEVRGQLTRIEQRVVRTEASTVRTEQIALRTEAKLVDLVGVLETSGFILKAENEGLERRMIIALARRLKPNAIMNMDQAIGELEDAIEIALRVIERGKQEGAHEDFLNDIFARMADYTKSGELDKAAIEIDEALARLDREDGKRQAKIMQSRIALLEAGFDHDMMRGDALSAAKKFSESERLKGDALNVSYFFSRPPPHRLDSLEGYESGQEGIYPYGALNAELALLLLPKANSHDSFVLSDHFGRTVVRLIEGGLYVDRIEEAVEGYRRSFDIVPVDISSEVKIFSLNNFGCALLKLGEKSGSKPPLMEAIKVFQEVLETAAVDKPVLHERHLATFHHNLGFVHAVLAQRTGNEEDWIASIEAYRNALALLERNEKSSRFDRARTSHYLSCAYFELGVRRNLTSDFEKAYETFETARKDFYRIAEVMPKFCLAAIVATDQGIQRSLEAMRDRAGTNIDV
jgi:tetratricopeptide (TPR) repeat protein